MIHRRGMAVLALLLCLCLVAMGFQGLRAWRVWDYWSDRFLGDMINAGIGFDRLVSMTDQGDISLSMPGLYDVTPSYLTVGHVLDGLVQGGAPSRGVLGLVDDQLRLFVRELCEQRGLRPPTAGSRENDVLPPEDFAKLGEVYAVYREHFTARVVNSRNNEKYRRTLGLVHQELRERGLDQLLRNPERLNVPWR